MVNLEFENIACNICCNNNFDIYLDRKDLNTFLLGTFRLVKCKNCGLVYQNPRPSKNSWEMIYPNDYDQYEAPIPSKNILKRYIDNYGLHKRAKIVSKYCDGGNLCDIGCSTGDFLLALQKYPKWNGYGVEPKISAVEIAKARGLSVQQGFFNENTYPNLRFDVITLWNTIEHLFDPSATLHLINERLNNGGMVIFNTPNLDSFDARIFGKHWIGFELPRHFYVFSEKTLDLLLTKTGFTIEQKLCFYGQHSASMSSVRFLLRDLFNKKLTRVENLLFSFPIKAFLLPFFFLQDKIKKSSQLTIIARKI